MAVPLRESRIARLLFVACVSVAILAGTLFVLTIGTDLIVPRTVYGGPGPATPDCPNVTATPWTCVTPWGIKVTCPAPPSCEDTNCTAVACVANPANYSVAVALLGLFVGASAAAIAVATYRRVIRRRAGP
jgi:hypothetical protein